MSKLSSKREKTLFFVYETKKKIVNLWYVEILWNSGFHAGLHYWSARKKNSMVKAEKKVPSQILAHSTRYNFPTFNISLHNPFNDSIVIMLCANLRVFCPIHLHNRVVCCQIYYLVKIPGLIFGSWFRGKNDFFPPDRGRFP